jgi:ATP-binding cassette, subfamily B, bacterial
MDAEPAPERLSTRHLIRTAAFVAGLVWQADRRHLTGIAAVQLVTAAGLAGLVLLTRELLGAGLGAGAEIGGEAGKLIPILIGLVALGSVNGLLRNLTQSWQRLLAARTDRHIMSLVLRSAADAELLEFEDPTFYNRLQRATFASRAQPVMLVTGLIAIVQSVVSVAAVGAAFVVMAWWLLPLCALAPLPLVRAARRERDARYALHASLAENRRRREYLERLLTGRDEAKEVRAFDLGDTIRGRWDGHYTREIEAMQDLQRTHVRSKAVARLLGDAVTIAVIAVIWLVVDAGGIDLPTALALLTGLYLLSTRLQAISYLFTTIGDVVLYMEDLRAFSAVTRAAERGPQLPGAGGAERTGPVGPFRSLTLEDVGFSYPGSPNPVLAGVSLTVRAGEIVALVGTNGSGKTTLAKIMAGLYPAGRGRLVRDGREVVDGLATLRDGTAVMFQDFVRYRLTAADNIAFGRPGPAPPREAVARAACQAGIAEAIFRLPAGYDTMLSKEFANGSDLSLGLWQRMALARAFYRDAPFVILDEPSSSLDAQAEADLFNRLRELFAGRTVLFISHRFANVRTADQIYLLDGGRIAEHGTHESLMGHDGLYARLFRLQADGYREGVPTG